MSKRRLPGPAAGMGGMVGLWGASSLIESVQRGATSVGASASPVDTTITAVDTSRTSLVYHGTYLNFATGIESRKIWPMATLQSSTSVRAEVSTAGVGIDALIAWQVVQWRPGIIKSIQRGELAIGAGVGNAAATVTAVNRNQCIVSLCGFVTNSATTYDLLAPSSLFAYFFFESDTSLRAYRPGTSGQINIKWEVVEFF